MVEKKQIRTSFLGTGWSFPPEFLQAQGEVRMSVDEEDIAESLKILLGTAPGERFLQPGFGIDLRGMLFEPMSTTMKTLVKDRIRTAILVYEPRIDLLALELDTIAQYEGKIRLLLEYKVRATNSRFNLVYPFYETEGNEARNAARLR